MEDNFFLRQRVSKTDSSWRRKSNFPRPDQPAHFVIISRTFCDEVIILGDRLIVDFASLSHCCSFLYKSCWENQEFT